MSKRTKWLLSIGVIATLIVGWQVAAFAVHDEVFELEGDAVDETQGGISDPSNNRDDWENVVADPPTHSADETSFAQELDVNETIFTGGGSKDPQDIPNWAWKNDAGGLPDKANLQHSFAAAYTVGTGSSARELLYFGADRIDGSGDAALAFWFLQKPVALDPPLPASAGGFSEEHMTGDLLVISNFSNGGVVSTITTYEWNTLCTKQNVGNLVNHDNDPATPLKKCGAENLVILSDSADANCDSPNPDNACAIVNGATTTLPWTFQNKSGTPNNQALKGEFFEGGVDLTDLGLAGQCFSTAVAETRTSTSPTSTLKDFTIGSFGQCGSTTTTTPKDNAGNTIGTGDAQTGNSANPISIGTGSVQVKDSAAITVTGGSPTWSGNVQFFLCKLDGTALCTSGGEQIGGNVAVSNTTPTATSAAATVTAAGRYCWRAVFSGDAAAGVAGSSDSRITECFKVNPVTPTLSTSAGPDVNLGNAVTDTATLTGTATQPGTTNGVTDPINPTTAGLPAGGTITFKLYASPSSGTGCGNLVFTSNTFAVSGDRNANTTPSSYGPASFTPTAPGTYHWVAEYSGNSPNTNGASHNAPDPNTAGSGCTDANETVVVNQVASTIRSEQTFVLTDKAIVSAPGGGNLAGSVKFELFPSSDCTGQAIYTETKTVSGASPQEVSTTPQTFTSSAPNLSWQLTYTSTNQAQKSIPASCQETSAVTINNGQPVSSQ
jgi:hypothetical protein